MRAHGFERFTEGGRCRCTPDQQGASVCGETNQALGSIDKPHHLGLVFYDAVPGDEDVLGLEVAMDDALDGLLQRVECPRGRPVVFTGRVKESVERFRIAAVGRGRLHRAHAGLQGSDFLPAKHGS